jgi:hypothetical protein
MNAECGPETKQVSAPVWAMLALPRNRRAQIGDLPRLRQGCEFRRNLGAHRAGLDQHRARCHPCNDSIGPEHRAAQRFIVGQRGHDQALALDGYASAGHRCQTLLIRKRKPRRARIENGDIEAGLHRPRRHRKTDLANADPADGCSTIHWATQLC